MSIWVYRIERHFVQFDSLVVISHAEEQVSFVHLQLSVYHVDFAAQDEVVRLQCFAQHPVCLVLQKKTPR